MRQPIAIAAGADRPRRPECGCSELTPETALVGFPEGKLVDPIGLLHDTIGEAKASNISIVRQAMPSAWPTRRRLDFCSTMPDGARIALQFVINYEEGAENSILHGDTAAEAFLSEWIGAQRPWACAT